MAADLSTACPEVRAVRVPGARFICVNSLPLWPAAELKALELLAPTSCRFVPDAAAHGTSRNLATTRGSALGAPCGRRERIGGTSLNPCGTARFQVGARRQHPGDDGDGMAAADDVVDGGVFGKGVGVNAHGLIAATPGDTIDLRTGDIKPNNPADLVHMGRGGFLSEKRAQEKPAASSRVFKPALKFRSD